MAWERYMGPECVQPLREFVSIRSNGAMAFSQGAIVRYDIQSYKYVVLHFDLEEGQIGIQLFKASDAKLLLEPGCIRMRNRHSDRDITINGEAFFKYFEIRPRYVKGKYPIKHTKLDDKMFLRVDLLHGRRNKKALEKAIHG